MLVQQKMVDCKLVLEGTGDVSSVAFSPDSKLLVSASYDNTVRLWNLPNGDLHAELCGHTSSVRSVAFSPDGQSIVTGSYDKTIRTWSITTKQQLKILDGHSSSVTSVAWSPNGDLIASGSWDKTVILWDAISGSVKKKLTGHTSWVWSVSFSQNGNKLASAGSDEIAIIWDVNSGAALIKLAHSAVFPPPLDFGILGATVWSVCFSPNDQFVVIGCSDKIVRMFNADTGHEEKRFEGHTDLVKSVTFSFDGLIIASGSNDHSVRLWDVASAKQFQQLDGHAQTVTSVAFSRDGKFIASGSADHTVRLWNIRPLSTSCFYGHVDDVQSQLDNDALVNLKGPYGFTPLHYAIDQQQIQVIQLLLERGADINITDDQKRTAVEFAFQSGNATIISLLNQAASLQNQGLKSIPESALQQTKPFFLRLDHNQLGPDTWHTLTSSNACQNFLVGLYLQSNPSLRAVPADLPQLGALKHLSVANCGLLLVDIHGIATSCANLLSLDLSNNPLGDLPDEFGEMKQLTQLDVSQCNLSSVPFVILQMKSLCYLNMGHNPLHGLPFDLGYLPLLTKLTLIDCPLTTIPIEYHDSPTLRLLRFLRDSQESEAVYRSKLLLVGYGEVGKTTLLMTLFPLQSKLFEKASEYFLQASCQIQGQHLEHYWGEGKLIRGEEEDTEEINDGRRHYVYERGEQCQDHDEDEHNYKYIENSFWLFQQPIDLSNATIKTAINTEQGWAVQAENSTVLHEFKCSDAFERDEWVRTCKFVAHNSRTDGISVIQRQIKSEELDAALRIAPPNTPNLALFEYDHKNKLPEKKCLELSCWDFAGQYEYQDGHQMFLMSRAIYLVLWDVTPSKRKQELAKLRHWLITLQLHLGTTNNNMRSSVLVYIVGTHVDSDDFLLQPCLEQVKQVLIECNFTLPHRIVDPIDARNQDHVNKLKNQLLADMAVQSHLGELVPKGYLQIENQLMEEQKKYRLNMLQGGNDVIVPIIQRKVLSERWQRDIPYVTRALELLNLWGSIVYFGRESNKQRHVFLDELVVCASQWLSVSVLGSIVQLMRQQKDKLKKNNSSSGYEPIVLHGELIKLSSVWQNIPSDLHEHVMEMLYSLDLGFSVSPASDQSKPFGERSSFFPQLLPFLPPQLLTWQANASTAEAVYIIKLNGFAMGFHGVLFTRLQSLLKSAEYGSCWQCGFLFSDVSQSILVTIHDDTQQIRICIRNSSNPSKVFNDIRVVVASLIDERYRGVRMIGEFIECACEDCKNVKWRWNSKIYDQVCNDSNIQSLCKDTTSRAELAIAMGHHNQPDGSPYLFKIEDIMNTPSSQTSLLCTKSHNAVLVSALKHLIEQPVPSIPVSATFPARIALVVGNDNYVQRDQLNHGVLDAASVRNRLCELGFQTIHVFDGTKQQIDEAIQDYHSGVVELANGGTKNGNELGVLSVIYLSGHAYQKDGVNFYVSSDEEPIKLQDVVTQVKSIRKQNSHLAFPVCVILDACRTGKDAFVFQELKTDLDYLFVYSCRSGQRAFDGFLHDEHSPFATAVLRHLQRGRSLHDICADIIIDTDGAGQQPMFVNSCRKRVIL